MSSVRSGDLLANTGIPRVFSGLYQFTGPALKPGTNTVTVQIGATKRNVPLSIIPDSIPTDGLHILLTSCFHIDEASGGAIRNAVDSLKRRCGPRRAPHFSILMGDQVYLDLPTLENLPTGRQPLAAIFEDRYLVNWRGGNSGKNFDAILSAAPYFALSDDHEFWNNYPHRSPIIQNSYRETHRNNWSTVSKAMFSGFQAFNPPDPAAPIRVDLDELSFLLIDTRFARTNDTFLPPGGLAAVTTWVDDLNASGRIGLIVTGQSLYADAAGVISGSVADYEYPDYGDFEPLARQLARVRTHLMCLTGDVHWGRVVKSQSRQPASRCNVHEVITSPSALVTTVGRDGFRQTIGGILGIFGRRDPWPRHTQPEADDLSPEAFANGVISPTPYNHFVMQGRDAAGSNRAALLKGDQISLLSFTTNPAGRITATVRYWSVDGQSDTPVLAVRLFDMSRP